MFMADHLTSEKRSWNMSRIKGKNTSPEKTIRKYLYARGFRYRVHSKSIIGKPDISNKSKKIAIFVNGCFWHRHGCNKTTTPKSNVEFWKEKFERTVTRDKENFKLLTKNKWKIIVLWECKIHNVDYLKTQLSKVI